MSPFEQCVIPSVTWTDGSRNVHNNTPVNMSFVEEFEKKTSAYGFYSIVFSMNGRHDHKKWLFPKDKKGLRDEIYDALISVYCEEISENWHKKAEK